jgi:hypothetical protein
MLDSAHVLDVLFGTGNALWRRETQHEAMLLMTALYKADAGAREKISSALLAGPPSQLLKEEVEKEKDGDIFEMLAFSNRNTSRFFLRRNASSPPLENNIRNGNQLSVLVCRCGLSHLTWTRVFPLTKSIRPHRKISLIRSFDLKNRWANREESGLVSDLPKSTKIEYAARD